MTSLDSNQYSDYTKYPTIFENVYWGNFKLGINDSPASRDAFQEICNNRNRFVEEYNIIKQYSNPARKIREKITDDLHPWCRHIEYYKTNDKKTIVAFSKFVDKDNEHNAYLNKGYEHIYPIYAMDQNTYVKTC